MRKPRRFTDEFKREAVALLQTSGRPLIQIARELGIQPAMLRNWRKNAGAALPSEMQATSPQAGSSSEQSAEIASADRAIPPRAPGKPSEPGSSRRRLGLFPTRERNAT